MRSCKSFALSAIVVFTALFAHVSPSVAAEFRFKENAVGLSNLELKGPINRGDFQRLQQLVRTHPFEAYFSFGIELDSPGGDVLEAIKIAEFARDMFWAVLVKGPCASACFFIYVAAPVRVIDGGSIGIHRPYFDRRTYSELSPDQIRRGTVELNDGVRAFLSRNQAPAWIGDLMFSKASDQVAWLNGRQIEELGNRAPYAHELILAKCGRDKDIQSSQDLAYVTCLVGIGNDARIPIVSRLSKGTPEWRAFLGKIESIRSKR